MKDNCFSCSQIVRLLILAFILSLVSSCGGGSSSSVETDSVSKITTTGVAQKGPFALNSSVIISRLDAFGNPTGETISTKVSSKTGEFEFEIPEQWNENVPINFYIEVQGKVFDESSGAQSNEPIILSSFTQSAVNNFGSNSVNLLTHWQVQRTKALLAEGKSFTLSIKQANDELFKIFGIDQVHALDISGSEFASDNAMLLLLSGALMDVAREHEVETQLLIDEISEDFSSDGKLSAQGDQWFLRMQATIRDDPGAHLSEYVKVLKEKQSIDAVSVSDLPNSIPLASRPVANLPSELFAEPGETIVLDGSASHDSGNIINFTWFRVDQQTQYPVPVSDRFIASPSITVPSEAQVLASPNQEIALLYALVVTDQEKLTHTGVVKVIVKKPPVLNTPPIAESQELTTDEDTPLKITLEGSDADGDQIAYNLNTPQSLAHGILELDTDFGSALPRIIYTPTKDYFGPDSFTFLVNDGLLSSNLATVTILVNPVNDPPVAFAGSDQTVEGSEVLSLNGFGLDVDGFVEGYLWAQSNGPTVSTSDTSISNLSFTAPDVFGISETLTFNLIVTDNEGADSIADSVDIIINPLNQPPVAYAGLDQTVITGDSVTLKGSGTDFDGNIVSYQWTHSYGTTITLNDATIPNPSFTAPAVSSTTETYTFNLIVTDDDGVQSAVDSVDIVVNPPANIKPVADAGPDQTINSIKVYLGGGYVESTPEITLDGSSSSDVEDATSDLSFNWTQVDGPVSIDPDDLINPAFNISAVDSDIDGDYIFRLVVMDSGGLMSDPDEITITVSPASVGLPPTAEDLDLPLDTSGSGYATVVALIGNDPDGDNADLIYEIVTLPTPSKGEINFPIGDIPGNGNIVEYQPNSISFPDPDSFTYRVRDGQGLSSNIATVNLTVPNTLPTANSFTVATNQGVAVSILEGQGEIEGFDLDGDPLSVVDVTNPSNGTLIPNTTSGVTTYTYTPNASFFGVDTFTYKVNDGIDNSESATVTINVNARPIANAGSDRTVTQGDYVTLPGSGSSDPDGDISDFVWLWSQNADDPDQVQLINADTETPSFDAPTFNTGDPDKILNFDLYVTDNKGLTSLVDSVRVTVTETCISAPPTIVMGQDRLVIEGSEVTLIGIGFGDTSCQSENYYMEIDWVQIGPTALTYPVLDPSDPLYDFNNPTFAAPDVSSPTILEFEMSAYDFYSNTATGSVSVTVYPTGSTLPSNQKPLADAKLVANNTHVEVLGNGNGTTIQLSGNDPDGDNLALIYQIVKNPVYGTLGDVSNSFQSETGSVFYRPNYPVQQSDSFEYVAIDQNGLASDPVLVEIEKIAEPLNNNPPVVSGASINLSPLNFANRQYFFLIDRDGYAVETDPDDYYDIKVVSKDESNGVMFDSLTYSGSPTFGGLYLRASNIDTSTPANGEYVFFAVDKYGRESVEKMATFTINFSN